MSAPIYNPIVPFNMGVSVMPGSMFHVKGVPTGNRFSVNFKTGPDSNSDTALHFNPRFNEGNIVVRNTKRSGRWEGEERHSNGFPFIQGQAFEIIFLCQPHQFKVAVNGRHFIEYTHRVGYHAIRYLTVEGAVNLSQIRMEQETTPTPQPVSYPRKKQTRVERKLAQLKLSSQAQSVISHPKLPCTATVPFSDITNRKVTVSGIPENRHPQKIMVSFQTTGPNANRFLQFAARMNEQVVVRNTYMHGSWEGEERHLGLSFPFQYGVPYQLTFFVDYNAFRVELNGMVICTFNHRHHPLNQIRVVHIDGSTSVSRIAFE